MSAPLKETKSKTASITTSEEKTKESASIGSFSLDLEDVERFVAELSSSEVETDDILTPLPPSGKDDVLSPDDMMELASKSHQRGKSASAVGAAFPGKIGASRSDYTLPSTEVRSSEDFTTELKLDGRRTASAEAMRVRSRSVFNLRDFVGESDAGMRLAEDWGVITDPDATQVLVRGTGYLSDKKKIKSLPRICPLVAAECWQCEKRIDNLAGSEYRTWYSENIDPLDDSVFVVVVHLQVESIGACFIHYHILEGGLPAKTKDEGFNSLFNRLVQTAEYPYYGSTRRAESPSPTASVDSSTSAMESATATKSMSASSSSATSTDDTALPYSTDAERAAFEEECMEFKKNRLKLIPKLVKGPFLVKRMVQNTPCILGRAVPHKYFRGRNYLEIDAQVDESYMSATILKLCHSYSTQIVVDMYWTIEGIDKAELPEHVMLGVSLHNIDFSKTTELTLKSEEKKKGKTKLKKISSPRGRKKKK